MKILKKNLKIAIEEQNASSKIIIYLFDDILKKKLTHLIFKLGHRIDGRNFDQVRVISTEVGLLPFTHGSALFTSWKNSSFSNSYLGGGQDEQKIEGLMGETVEKAFMLHYNFPPFSVGEVRPVRGPGRREIGHGHLAASAIEPMLPNKEAFPYTITNCC